MTTETNVTVLSQSDKGVAMCAAAARISTTQGDAIAVFEQSTGGEKDVRLVGKVLSSGHTSVMEHHVLSVAFRNVSVLVEQFLIEFRLASFTVKSRRYVDFANAGFTVPEALAGAVRDRYVSHMRSLFQTYEQLTQLGVPKEDARFVLPYCFHSNFYVTANAREWVRIISEMRAGRGKAIAELRGIGEMLFRQFDPIYPGIIEKAEAHMRAYAAAPASATVGEARVARGAVALLGGTENAPALMSRLLESGRVHDLRALVADDRPRELEFLNYAFQIDHVSLACVTHFARHRMQSPIYPATETALAGNAHILPETVRANDEARSLYEDAFARNERVLNEMLKNDLPQRDQAYFALSGNTVSIQFSMNARELMHFMRLRTCARAQWEIRELARAMLGLLRDAYPALFALYGPSCAMDGRCPEGRLSCGAPKSLT